MNILICLGEGIGNMVQATPCIEAIHRLGHDIDLYLDGNWSDAVMLFDGWDIVGGIYDPRVEPPCDQYDMIVRTIWGRWPREVMRRQRDFSLSEVGPSWLQNEVHQNLILAERMGWSDESAAPWGHVEFDPFHGGTDFVAICPGHLQNETWKRKSYPHWPAVIDKLTARGIDYVILAHPSDREAWWESRNVIDNVSIREAAGILKAADVCLGVDNGLCHVAAAVGTPVVVVFGATPVAKCKPWGRRVEVVSMNMDCQPCADPDHKARWDACTDWPCMTDLQPQVVFNAAWAMRQEGRRRKD